MSDRRARATASASPAVRDTSTEDPAQPSGLERNGDGGNSALSGAEAPELRIESGAVGDVFAPEDFQLDAGVPSTIDRDASPSPADVFRCPSCTEPECQVSLGPFIRIKYDVP